MSSQNTQEIAVKEEKVSWWIRFRSTEFVYAFEKRYIDSWYYPVKDFLFPWNRMRIRNCPRSYQEPGYHCLHAVFTLLCRHIDGNEGGREKFVKRIAMLKEDRDTNGTGWYDASVEMLAAYDFYNGINWKNPSGYDWDAAEKVCKCKDCFSCTCDRTLMNAAIEVDEQIDKQAHQIVESLIKTIGYWWS